MDNFRIGDKVYFFYYNNDGLHDDISYGIVTSSSYEYVNADCKSCKQNHIFRPHELRIYQKSLIPKAKHYGHMKKLSLIAQRLLDKDLRTLVKAGILNEELAVEDTDFVLSYFVSEYKEELAKAASKLVKEKKKKCEEDED